MPLSLNEIRSRALAFAKEWQGATSERAEAQSFWNEFFNVFGINRRRVAAFEHSASRFSGSKHGRIDVFWPGVMLAEHKSHGADLDAAFEQAIDYFGGLKDSELPRYVLVSDFARFRLHDLEDPSATVEFALADLHKEIGRFGFISGYQTRSYKEEDPVNVQAAERMGKLYDALKAAGYEGHALEVLLVRLLFCLFADDTGIFPRHAFHDLIEQRTREDGSDLGMWLTRVFQLLNTPEDRRQRTEDEQLRQLPYVNGKLFEEMLPLAAFDSAMRGLLLDASLLDWSRISPAIFGSMFQSVMDAKARRNLGAHYTSEKNILKLIGPLFLDELKAELERAGKDSKRLDTLHRKIAALKLLDPACGCGNFLVIAYRELRLLEMQILKRQFATQRSVLAHVQDHVLVNVDQFYGIEIEEFPAQIAQVALWLMDHQMNLLAGQEFGENIVRLPLKKSATIKHGNALTLDWNSVVPVSELSYILGNPPFIGSKMMSAGQRDDLLGVTSNLKGAGVLDFVAAWYLKAACYIGQRPIRAAFVSTNSITQGEQVSILWGEMLRLGFQIFFAHRTFQWNNEAKGVAAVHCVIVGFANGDIASKRLFDYQDIRGEAQEIAASNVNPYLVDADNALLPNRRTALCAVPEIGIGNKPIDGGHYLFSTEARDAFIANEPQSAAWFRRWLGSDEFINGWERWCLWLGECSPAQLRAMPACIKRVEAVKQFRLASKSAPTQKLAQTPTRFHVENIPDSPYLVIPRVSSERRNFIPIGFIQPDTLCSDSALIIPNATLYHFGIVTSSMHMAWVRAVCGRLKSDYRYSAGIVYNNFPWPEGITANSQQPNRTAGFRKVPPIYRKSGPSRTRCARAIPRQHPGRPVRPADHAAGLGQGPSTPGQGCGCGLHRRRKNRRPKGAETRHRCRARRVLVRALSAPEQPVADKNAKNRLSD